MAALLGAIFKAKEHVLGEKEPSIDNWTFRLYYQWSTSILLGASVLVTANNFFGEPIMCDLPKGGVSEETLNSYCWMYSSFDIPKEFSGECARKKSASTYGGIQEDIYNTYYQWVSLCLVGQAILFYLPRMAWLSMEGGLMKHLAKDKQGKVIEDAEEKCNSLLYTYREHLRNKYNRYFAAFFGCEVLNLVVVISQMYLTDRFLGHQFLNYGINVYRFYQLPSEETQLMDIRNPMCEAFPRIASCQFYMYGSGGKMNSLNALCILALNVIIDKVYLILWWWYIILILFGFIRLIQRVLQTSALMRFHWMKFRMQRYFKDNDNTEKIKLYIKENCTIGDWFVLYQMSKNMNRKLFFNLMIKLSLHVKIPELEELKCVSPFGGKCVAVTEKEENKKDAFEKLLAKDDDGSDEEEEEEDDKEQESRKKRGGGDDDDDDNKTRRQREEEETSLPEVYVLTARRSLTPPKTKNKKKPVKEEKEDDEKFPMFGGTGLKQKYETERQQKNRAKWRGLEAEDKVAPVYGRTPMYQERSVGRAMGMMGRFSRR